ncbi:hypothetical protein O181_089092 [Austropuccinia psidii MF-1]|uniref:Reverse transcriptase Ty1/copia-type domain-containing protein n=1 Tax=Austropuccinia psidii MF-1 TaxID=1389203 RepID=A0A9Q3ISX8_9BASI|nr:hypothetical protein [Austropuccinia psidii MF-1]
MDSGTGNVKITNHVKFLPKEFPFLKSKSTPINHESFVLVPNQKDTLSKNASTKQSLSDKEQIAAQIPVPVHKGYSWVPEQESIPQNKIFGDVGNPINILTHQRRPRHHANLADHLYSDPKTYQEAVNGPNSQEWKSEIKSELNNMTNHHVWIPTTSDQDVKPLSTMWVFKRKTDKDGNLSKFKARLCVRGFSQKEGIDYTEVFSPTGILSFL